MLRSKLSIVTLAILLSMPTFALAWGGKGDAEPDTALDKTHDFMFGDTAADIALRTSRGGLEPVYFNAFPGTNTYQGAATSFNTNFATVGSKIQNYPYQVFALLGAWKDCNGDGFIGFGDNALFEYRADLLVGPYNTGTCPAEPLVPTGSPPAVHRFPHNDGVWVHELLPIGWDTGANFENNALNLNDSTSRVWGDWGLPQDAPGGQCYVRPWPYGSMHSAGGLLAHLDCFTGARVQPLVLTVTGLTGTTSTYQTVASTQPWGSETDASMVQAWDCGQAQTAQVGPQTFRNTPLEAATRNATVWANVSAPNTGPTPNTGGSLAGTANATASGTDRCQRRADVNGGGRGGQAANAPYPIEGDVRDQVAVRFQTDQTLGYNEGTRPAVPFSLLSAVPGARWTPSDGGTRATGSEGLWSGNSITAASRNPYVSRQDLGVSKVTYTTYYASVGSAAVTAYNLALPSTTPGAYGSAACGTHTTGVWNGWDCDATHWWPNNADGSRTMPTATIDTQDGLKTVDVGAAVGTSYNLMDVDCYDASVNAARGLGVGYGILTGAPCS